MWWIPAGLLGGYVLKKIFEDDSCSRAESCERKSCLEENMTALGCQLVSNEGMKVAIIGQPGSGKSTILKKITFGKVDPLPVIGQQTDATNWHTSGKNDFFSNYRGVRFVDIPGYDTFHHPVESYLKYFPFSYFDKIIFVMNNKIHDSDIKIFNRMKETLGEALPGKLLLVRSFSDGLNDCTGVRDDLNRLFHINKTGIQLVFASGRSNDGMEKIIDFCAIGSVFAHASY